jgi:hypothetical protein
VRSYRDNIVRRYYYYCTTDFEPGPSRRFQETTVRRRERGIGTVVREMFRQAGGAKGPFVLRNSLAKTLSYYSGELGALGAKIEAAPKTNQLDEHRPASLGGDSSGKDGGEGAPPHGNSRVYDDDDDDDDGGAGNLILIHFSRRA